MKHEFAIFQISLHISIRVCIFRHKIYITLLISTSAHYHDIYRGKPKYLDKKYGNIKHATAITKLNSTSGFSVQATL